MLRFLIKISIYAILFLGILELLCVLLSPRIAFCKKIGIKKNYQGAATLLYKARKKIDSDTIHLGDSVARQIFPPQLADHHLTGNATILLSGNYILTKELIEHNPHITDIYLGQIPAALRCEYEHKNTVNNFVKPFLSLYNGYFLIPQVLQKLKEHPYTLWYLSYASKFAPLDEYNLGHDAPEAAHISEYNIEFLKKIIKLCNQNNVKLHLYSPPLSDNRIKRLETYNTDFLSEEDAILKPYFEDYYNSFKFVEEARFSDGMHLNKNYLHKNRARLQKYYLSL